MITQPALLSGFVAASLLFGAAGDALAQAEPVAPPSRIVNPPPPVGVQVAPQPYYAPPGTVVYPGGQPYYAPTAPPPPPGYQAQPYPPPGYQAQPYPQAYGQPMPPPPPVRYEYRRPNRGMLIAGIAILGGSYFLTAVPAALWNAADNGVSSLSGTATHGTYWPLYVPVFGPWIELRYLNTNPYYDGWSVLASIPCVLSGLAQATGLALTIAGALTGSRVPVRDNQVLSSSFSVAPITLPGGGGGLAASGSF